MSCGSSAVMTLWSLPQKKAVSDDPFPRPFPEYRQEELNITKHLGLDALGTKIQHRVATETRHK